MGAKPVTPRVFSFANLDELEVHAAAADVVSWGGRGALRLENGLAMIRDLVVQDGALEVDLGTDGPAYPGIAFRAADPRNFELVYVQPHTSGQWDAVQYDPVFHGVNTWQIFNGPRYQGQATIPSSATWVTLRLDVLGSRVAVTIGDQRPLVVDRLAHGFPSGRIGVWTYRAAYFSAIRLGAPDPSRLGPASAPPVLAEGTVRQWWLAGYGPVSVEENGTLNLNRYLPGGSGSEATLRSDFLAVGAGTLVLRFGFSDELDLFVDDARVFTGSHRFTGFQDRRSRGYVEPGANEVRVPVSSGQHVLVAKLKASEPFGWGMALSLHGEGGTRIVLG